MNIPPLTLFPTLTEFTQKGQETSKQISFMAVEKKNPLKTAADQTESIYRFERFIS
jgi:hypothetical protein